MTALFLSNILLSLGVGLSVLAANPRRRSNQALAAHFILVAVWVACVWQIVQHEARGESSIGWIRANVVIAASFPLCVWLLRESIVASHGESSPSTRRALPWIVVTLFAASLPFFDSFVLLPSGSGVSAIPLRGWSYFVYIGIEATSYLVLLGQTLWSLRRLTGIQKLELQFLTLCLIGVGFTTFLLNGLGNLLHNRELKLLPLPIVLLGLTITAWTITFHRIFSARQVLLQLCHHLGAFAILIISTLGFQYLLRAHMEPPANLIIGIVLGGTLAILSFRTSRRWWRFDGTPSLVEMRAIIIAATKTEPDFHALLGRFESTLRTWCETPVATLLIDEVAGSRAGSLHLSKKHPARTTLCALGWATPESLRRRRYTPASEDLNLFLDDHGLGLVLIAPRESPSPSLILALGRKASAEPFTYPEIQRLQTVVELMDNILSHARLTAQSALQAKTEHLAMLSRGLAHDLKNLLTPVSSFLVHTSERFSPDSIEGEVHAAAQRSVRIMTDYVREAGFFAERLQPRYETTALRPILESVRDLVATRATTRNISIVTQLGPENSIVVDRVLVQRLLGNLVSNAIDASSFGQKVTLSGASENGLVQFQVADNGCGIPAENLSRIFDPYFTTKEFGDELRGLGLGLTICQKIAALHQGMLSVESTVGRGTIFTVDLPSSPSPLLDGATSQPPKCSLPS